MKDLLLGKVSLRKLDPSDNIILAELANNKKVWDNLTDLMPHPYSIADANSFINMSISSETNNIFAIEFDSTPCGVIGLHRQSDVFRLSAELGYWIGEPYWNKGITTCAVKLIVMYGFENLGLERIYACVYDFNTASQRVLEKCGFIYEGRSRKAVIKNGIIYDDLRYGIIRDDITDIYLNN